MLSEQKVLDLREFFNEKKVLKNGQCSVDCDKSVWKDKLISYDGKVITYDLCGNPLNYLGKDMKWNSVNGSLLSIKDGSETYEYTYLSDGQRLSKKVDGQNTVYIYNAGMLLAEETDKDRLNFYYDADGLIIEIGYQEKDDGLFGEEKRYFFTRNGQGDIVGIYRCSDSSLVGNYEYDLWGNLVSVIPNKEVTHTDELDLSLEE